MYFAGRGGVKYFWQRTRMDTRLSEVQCYLQDSCKRTDMGYKMNNCDGMAYNFLLVKV